MLVGWGLLLGRDLASPFHGAPKPHRGYRLDGTQNRSFLDETVAVDPRSGFQGVSAGLRLEPRGGFRDGPSRSRQS